MANICEWIKTKGNSKIDQVFKKENCLIIHFLSLEDFLNFFNGAAENSVFEEAFLNLSLNSSLAAVKLELSYSYNLVFQVFLNKIYLKEKDKEKLDKIIRSATYDGMSIKNVEDLFNAADILKEKMVQWTLPKGF